jgi:hypothetical protein
MNAAAGQQRSQQLAGAVTAGQHSDSARRRPARQHAAPGEHHRDNGRERGAEQDGRQQARDWRGDQRGQGDPGCLQRERGGKRPRHAVAADDPAPQRAAWQCRQAGDQPDLPAREYPARHRGQERTSNDVPQALQEEGDAQSGHRARQRAPRPTQPAHRTIRGGGRDAGRPLADPAECREGEDDGERCQVQPRQPPAGGRHDHQRGQRYPGADAEVEPGRAGGRIAHVQPAEHDAAGADKHDGSGDTGQGAEQEPWRPGHGRRHRRCYQHDRYRRDPQRA